MDFVEGLPAAVDTLEFLVDGLGRAEYLNGRVRLSYFREIRTEGGARLLVPAVCVAWALPALRQARSAFVSLWELTDHPERWPRETPAEAIGMH